MGILSGDEHVLLTRVREGDLTAFSTIYERYVGNAHRYALSLCRHDADADDIVSEAFVALLMALHRGSGPTDFALPYLFTTIRHAYGRSSQRQVREQTEVRRFYVAADGHVDVEEAHAVRAALSTLPADVRTTLWHAEVEDESIADGAAREEISPHLVATRRHRARQALSTAYLAQHAVPEGGVTDPQCRKVLSHLAHLVRGAISMRRRRLVEAHLLGCDSCTSSRRRLEMIQAELTGRGVPAAVYDTSTLSQCQV